MAIATPATATNPDPIVNPTWRDQVVIDWDSATSGSGASTVVPWQEDLGIGPAGVDAWQPTWVGPDLQAVLDDEAAGVLPDEPVGVVVWLRDDAALSLTFDVPFASLEEAIALGTVSPTDLPAQRAHLRSVLGDRELTITDLGDDALIGISPAHTRNLRRMRYIPAMHFDSKPSELRVMISADTFESIELDEDPTAQVDIDGREVEWRMNAERLTDFNLNGVFREVADFDGSGFEGLAMSELRLPAPAPNQLSATGSRRVGASRACSRSGCAATVVPPFVHGTSSGPEHPILTLSALAGDLTEGQDPGVTGALNQARHSGAARGATVDAWGYRDKADLVEMVDDIIDLVGTGGQIEILSNTLSQGVARCDPRHNQAKAWNELFEIASVLVFQSGNNDGSDSRDDCDVPGGAAAPASFVVNQMTDLGRLRDPRSGDATRSVIDMTAFGFFDLAAWDSLGAAGAKGYARTGGTSIATPLVAGIAALYTEMYRQQRSSRIDDPGLLKSNLLLMGDRTEGSLLGTSQTTIGYDAQWGAGRFSARTFRGSQGFLDGVWMSGRACVPHGKSRTIFHPVPTNARIVEAVAWSMDPRVSRNRAPNDVDLSVVEQTGTTSVTIPGLGTITLPIINQLAADRATADEKERVVFEEATPTATARPVGIRLKGMNIRGRDPVCGDDAERVYFAFRAEGT